MAVHLAIVLHDILLVIFNLKGEKVFHFDSCINKTLAQCRWTTESYGKSRNATHASSDLCDGVVIQDDWQADRESKS